jgi:hypothetical protein
MYSIQKILDSIKLTFLLMTLCFLAGYLLERKAKVYRDTDLQPAMYVPEEANGISNGANRATHANRTAFEVPEDPERVETLQTAGKRPCSLSELKIHIEL